jgi:zinc protease
MKILKVLAAFMALTIGIDAQQFKADDIIPFDTNVKTGKLSNGVTYFIRANKKPENRAELRLVVNAGSVLEDDNQQGLAHFVEHMCFNGTKNFEKNEIVNYLESIGMKFGPEINAYTSFDETVYMLQLPTEDKEILKKGFQILEDWAHNVSFEDEEIDRERGVITEEWRLGRGASARLMDKQFPVLLKNSRYAERLPIGKIDIIKNFEYETLKKFYRDWYRPDLMAVIAVGDFNVPDIEEIIKEHFGNLTPVENPRERKFFPVPDHSEVLYSLATDPEETGTSVEVYYKMEPQPEKTINDYKASITELIYNRMLSERLKELTLLPDPPFVMGSSSKGQFIRTKEFYYLAAAVNADGINKGLEALLTEAERVKRFGFTETELERTKTELLRYIERSYTERDKSPSKKYAEEYIRHFLKGEPAPGIEYEYELQKQIVPEITLAEVNALAGKWMTKENNVVMVSGPEKEGFKLPAEKELSDIFELTEKKDIEAYADNAAKEPLLQDIPSPGKITGEKYIPELNITELTLSNGVKVVLKPTDFKNDEILVRAYSPGGNSLIPDEEYIPVATAGQLVNQSGVGNFNNVELKKKLSGKVVGVQPYIAQNTEGIIASASPKDMETMFQLMYLYFKSPRIDSSSYLSYQSKVKTMIENREKSPESAYNDTLSLTLSQYHPRTYPWSLSTITKMDMDKSFRIYKDRFADASDFTFIIVGNFDSTLIRKYAETYLAALPSINRAETYKDLNIDYPQGVIKKEVKKGIEPKSYVTVAFTGPYKWSEENSYALQSMISAFKIKIREVLREDKGGTYGVKVQGVGKHSPEDEYEMDIEFGCAPDRVDELMKALFTQIDSLRQYPIGNDYVEKVKEAQKREIEVQRKENDYWVKTLQSYYFYNRDITNLYKEDERIDKLTAAMIQNAAKTYFNMDNYVSVILYPEK